MLTTFRMHTQEIKGWLIRLPTTKLIALALLGTYLAALPMVLCAPFLTSGQSVGGPGFGKHDILRMVLMGCIAAPLIETALNQWGCLRLLKKLRCKTSIAISISALIFGLCHNYSAPYVIFGTLVGAILSTVFAIEDARKGHPFIATFAVHALRNGITAAVTLFVL
jgi:uncharacterized protein